jgi:alpha-methylacyl-CoA racemase
MAFGPLQGLRVIQLGGIGPVPFAATLLADAGADLIRVDRPGEVTDPGDPLARNRQSLEVDLKAPEGRDHILRLAAQSDLLIEGFRPGVLERLGLGPEVLLSNNPAIVIGRMTGWGQSGPLAQAAGHDINFLALSGALASIGPPDGDPVPPLNLVADFGGGAMMLLFGVMAALHHARSTGQGQVVDAAMSDGCVTLMGIFQWMKSRGRWTRPRGRNWLDGGAPWYACYRCSDGKWIAVGAVEPVFRERFLRGIGLDSAEELQDLDDPDRWPEQRRLIGHSVAQRTRDQWCATFDIIDACVSPVLELDEVGCHPHHVARATVVHRHGVPQPASAPRFSSTPGWTTEGGEHGS